MKTIIIFLLLCAGVYAEVPGKGEIETSLTEYKKTAEEFSNYREWNFLFVYGTDFTYLNMYGLLDYTNNYVTGNNALSNMPFRDVYKIGIGLSLLDIYYIEMGHICSHEVISYKKQEEAQTAYKNMSVYTHNYVKIGLKIKFN